MENMGIYLGIKKEIIKKIVKSIDTNHDGEISKDEWID